MVQDAANRQRSIKQYSTWLQGFRVKTAFLKASFGPQFSPKKYLNAEKRLSKIEFCRQGFGVMLEYY